MYSGDSDAVLSKLSPRAQPLRRTWTISTTAYLTISVPGRFHQLSVAVGGELAGPLVRLARDRRLVLLAVFGGFGTPRVLHVPCCELEKKQHKVIDDCTKRCGRINGAIAD